MRNTLKGIIKNPEMTLQCFIAVNIYRCSYRLCNLCDRNALSIQLSVFVLKLVNGDHSFTIIIISRDGSLSLPDKSTDVT